LRGKNTWKNQLPEGTAYPFAACRFEWHGHGARVRRLVIKNVGSLANEKTIN